MDAVRGYLSAHGPRVSFHFGIEPAQVAPPARVGIPRCVYRAVYIIQHVHLAMDDEVSTKHFGNIVGGLQSV